MMLLSYVESYTRPLTSPLYRFRVAVLPLLGALQWRRMWIWWANYPAALAVADVQRGAALHLDPGGIAAELFSFRQRLECLAVRDRECTAQRCVVVQIHTGGVGAISIRNLARSVPRRPSDIFARPCMVSDILMARAADGWLLCSAALALTLIRHTAAHRHSAVPSSRFQILMIVFSSPGSFSLRGPQAVVRTRTTIFVRPPS